MPAHSPTTAGTKASCPMASDCSMAGIRRLQTDAATMTPAAKPKNTFCVLWESSFRKKNTMAAPVIEAKRQFQTGGFIIRAGADGGLLIL